MYIVHATGQNCRLTQRKPFSLGHALFASSCTFLYPRPHHLAKADVMAKERCEELKCHLEENGYENMVVIQQGQSFRNQLC